VASAIADQESIDALICILPCIPKDLVDDPSDRQEWMAATQRRTPAAAPAAATERATSGRMVEQSMCNASDRQLA
jgi:hypothetical protein